MYAPLAISIISNVGTSSQDIVLALWKSPAGSGLHLDGLTGEIGQDEKQS
jgi:hypothetical protein